MFALFIKMGLWSAADREVQRILLELLNQMDGFDQTTNVKVGVVTNRGVEKTHNILSIIAFGTRRIVLMLC